MSQTHTLSRAVRPSDGVPTGRRHNGGGKTGKRRIVVADDNQSFTALICACLHRDFDIIGCASSGEGALENVLRLEPDMLVLDIWMPDLDGFTVVRKLLEAGVPTRVVLASVTEDPDYVHAARELGACGYVFKSKLLSDLPRAMKDAEAGRFFASSRNE